VQFEKDALIKRIQELEKSEREISAQLENSLHFATSPTNRSTSVPEIPYVHRATPTQVPPLASRVTSIPETPQFNQTTSTQSMPQTDRSTRRRHILRSGRFTPVDGSFVSTSYQNHPVRKEKEPDKFDGRTVEWKDFIVHFEQVSDWNKLSYHEKSQQLVMCLKR
jgi:hypothetical protein